MRFVIAAFVRADARQHAADCSMPDQQDNVVKPPSTLPESAVRVLLRQSMHPSSKCCPTIPIRSPAGRR